MLLTLIIWLKRNFPQVSPLSIFSFFSPSLPYFPKESHCTQPILMLHYFKSGMSVKIIWNPMYFMYIHMQSYVFYVNPTYFMYIKTFWEQISSLEQPAKKSPWYKKWRIPMLEGVSVVVRGSPFWKEKN